MPHIGAQITPWGPLLNVYMMVSVPRQQALVKAGQAIPPGVAARLLVDTGASLTSIDSSIATKLALVPTGVASIHTPSTNGVAHVTNQYDIALLIPGQAPGTLAHSIPALPVIEGSFQVQGIDGLLGRDVLAAARMTYCGPDGILMMSF